ncbi:MAG: hypothetical protein KAX05_11475 [Bacteroidales bacterium]|nr:hypothetical protein [Bacteroidales bacterium]
MKINIFNSIIFLSLLVLGCSKEDSQNPQCENNALLKTKTIYNSVSPNTVPSIFKYQYDDFGNLIKELNYEREDRHLTRYFTYEYNDKNQLIKKDFFSENFDKNESSYKVIVKYTYQYENNKLIKKTKYRKTPNQENDFYIHEVHSYKYSNDKLIEEIIDYKQTGSQSKYLFEYKNNNLIKETQYLFYSDDIFKYVWVYDNYNRKIKEIRYCNNVENQETIFEYAVNKIINAKVYIGNDFIKEISYEYDSCGNLIQEKKEIKNPLSNEMPELIIYEYY